MRSQLRRVVHAILLGTMLFAMQAAAGPDRAEAQEGATQIDQPFTGTRPFQLDLHIGVAWWNVGLATGARFGIPIVHNGFVPSINNAVYINFGLDLYYVRYWDHDADPFDDDHYAWGPGFGFPVTMHWEFYFTDTWSAFAELGINVYIGPTAFDDDQEYHAVGGAWWIGAVGGKMHINDSLALVLRVGSPYTSFGLNLKF